MCSSCNKWDNINTTDTFALGHLDKLPSQGARWEVYSLHEQLSLCVRSFNNQNSVSQLTSSFLFLSIDLAPQSALVQEESWFNICYKSINMIVLTACMLGLRTQSQQVYLQPRAEYVGRAPYPWGSHSVGLQGKAGQYFPPICLPGPVSL